MAHWIGLVNGFSNLVSKINKVEIYIPNGSVKTPGLIYKTSAAKGFKSETCRAPLGYLVPSYAFARKSANELVSPAFHSVAANTGSSLGLWV